MLRGTTCLGRRGTWVAAPPCHEMWSRELPSEHTPPPLTVPCAVFGSRPHSFRLGRFKKRQAPILPVCTPLDLCVCNCSVRLPVQQSVARSPPNDTASQDLHLRFLPAPAAKGAPSLPLQRPLPGACILVLRANRLPGEGVDLPSLSSSKPQATCYARVTSLLTSLGSSNGRQSSPRSNSCLSAAA